MIYSTKVENDIPAMIVVLSVHDSTSPNAIDAKAVDKPPTRR
jgi:hypothetical protein